jgi:hypothetical protein
MQDWKGLLLGSWSSLLVKPFLHLLKRVEARKPLLHCGSIFIVEVYCLDDRHCKELTPALEATPQNLQPDRLSLKPQRASTVQMGNSRALKMKG